MHSNRSEYSHRRQHSERTSRQCNEYDDRREKRREPPRDMPREPYHIKYGADGHDSAERTRSREYSESPKRLYSKDSLSRDWSRKSPVRRRMSSPVWDPSEKKRQRFAEDVDRDYRYRHEPQDKMYRTSLDSLSRSHGPRNFEDASPQDEDFRYRKMPQDSRHRHRHEEFSYRQQNDELPHRQSSYKDGDGYERSRDRSPERAWSQDRFTRNYATPREMNDTPLTTMYDEDYREGRARLPLNGSSGQSFESDAPRRSAAVLEQKSTKGFQRFLEVLNKGVNVDVLTKIVTQTSTEDDSRPISQSTLTSPVSCPWSPTRTARRSQESRQDNCYWNESEGSRRLVSPQPHHRSLSPKRCPLSDERSLPRSDSRECYLHSRSRSPPVVERVPLTSEDEHKHRQMQHVLQAIGMDLGFEELGQMSHRIQERLYGKKDGDSGRKISREGGTKRAYSPRRQSRSSSSSRSSFSPLNQNYYMKKDLYSSNRDVADVHQLQVHKSVEYGRKTSSSSLQDNQKCESKPQESAAASQAFPPNSTYPVPKPPPAPAVPTYPPVNCSPLPYPTVPPAVPPVLPHVRPGIILPHLHPFIPYPGIQPMNFYPAMLPQARHIFPQQINHPQPQLLTQPNVSVNTTQKSKPLSRPRCLQVIDTKQPG